VPVKWYGCGIRPFTITPNHLPPMPDKTHLIRFKPSDLISHIVIAAKAEIYGEHLVFLRSDGSLAALFVLEVVESWSEVDH
jgi:hypothetical protein